MNRVINFIKRNKVISILSVLLIVGVVGIIIGLTFSDPNTGVLKNQVVDDLSFENADISYEDGISTFTVDVFNESDEEYNLKYINVKLTLSDSTEQTLVGYIGDSLDAGEKRIINAKIDADVSDPTALVYEIIK